MFSFNRKLEPNLKECINSNPYNNYRILIKYKRFQEGILKKISSYKGSIINHIEYSKPTRDKFSWVGLFYYL